MKNEIATKMSPEGLTIANTYLEVGNVPAVCARLKMDTAKVSEILNKREIKAYIDQVYLDTGYRNRFKLANSLDDLIEDLADLYVMAHKMRVDEMKAMTELEKAKASNIKNQTNVQINADLPFGQGNYGKLMEKLLSEDNNGTK